MRTFAAYEACPGSCGVQRLALVGPGGEVPARAALSRSKASLVSEPRRERVEIGGMRANDPGSSQMVPRPYCGSKVTPFDTQNGRCSVLLGCF